MNCETFITSIVTWNNARSIAACIESVLRQTRKPDDVYVYDNASTDNTLSIVERFREQVKIVRNDKNRGFGAGHNSIIQSSSSEFILLVNPDIVIQPQYLERALAVMEADPKIGAVCGLLLQNSASAGKEIVDGTGLLFSRSRRFVLRDHGRTLAGATRNAGEVFGCDGALPLFRRTMIEDISIGGFFFDPAFFAHKEDHDVAWRSRLLGWKTFFEPSCIAIHPRVFRPSDLHLRRQLSAEMKYHAVKNDLLMLLKNEQRADFWRNFFHIVPRRLAIMFYALIAEPRSLSAYWYVLRNLHAIFAQRKEIQRRCRVSMSEIRQWMA